MRRLCGLFLSSMLLCAVIQLPVCAAVLPSTEVAEDVGNGYRFEIPGIGGFSANGKNGETMSVGVITLDQGLQAQLYRDGEAAVFQNGMAITENGVYELRVFRETQGTPEDFGIYRFQIENNYADIGAGGRAEIRLVENPEMIPEYLPERGMYRYSFRSGRYFDTSVPVGGWSSNQIRLILGQGVNLYSARRDGELTVPEESMVFREYGSYEIGVRSNELGFEGEESYKEDIVFRLFQRDKAVQYDSISAPLGFIIHSCTLNGERQELSGATVQELRGDGEYRVEFLKSPLSEGEAPHLYTVEFMRDTTPPELHFSEDIYSGTVRKNLHFSCEETDAEIHIFKNYQRVVATGGNISQNGSYRLLVSDRYGNQREYRFLMQKTVKLFTPALIVIPLLLLLVGCVMVAVYWKRHMRVL